MTLAHRAQAELGERALRVRWLAHGRYRFKGVPAPLIVHEVGELGFAPLRHPPSGQKIWRELPIWRRPPVLAAEVLVFLGVVAFYGYGLLRSPPALAFNERDWVVVGDISNFTGDPRLEESIETAFRISLEQSRFVNAVPQLEGTGSAPAHGAHGRDHGRSRHWQRDRPAGGRARLAAALGGGGWRQPSDQRGSGGSKQPGDGPCRDRPRVVASTPRWPRSTR